ncbi:MAG: N-acyl homoserine lactonase family protein [Acidobacteriia bacterium]|nr:N-acyl homoserine lactonase family protein [Terriglobia bacterium]
MSIRKFLVVMLGAVPALLGQSRAPQSGPVRLYVFDNGVIRGIDPQLFQLKKEEVATADMVVASYLIVHPKGTLLWDTGASPDSALKSDGSSVTQGLYTAVKTLRSQLAAAGYAPKDVTYFGLSHYHSDHTANANDFAGATWLVQRPERDAMFAEKAPPIAQQARYVALKDAKTQILIGEDYDVFGDGTVVIKAAYGHTPGHQVLLVKLARTGPVLLAGDLYHYQEERGTSKTPSFEFSRDQSLASREKMEAFIKKTGAQLWIEHDLANFNKLKKSPDYYD